MRVGILTVSDRASGQQYEDRSGPLIERLIEERLGWEVAETEIVPDETAQIEKILIGWVDARHLNLIITTGGTGFSPRDVTPEATRSVIEREAPGLAEAMRAASLRVTPHAMLSRAVCGIRAQTLIVNLPGSPKAAKENLETLYPVLPHALELLIDASGADTSHQFVQRV
ncbi:MAG: molybdopterin adenylyltransferase [Anaerolineae bacterium]|nr:molybdopterin adenylyltransferase [Anaerolineae bacterium]